MITERDSLYIGGAWVPSSGSDQDKLINAATEEVYGSVPQATEADVSAAIAAARTAFDEGPWPRMKPQERAAVMLKMVEIMRRRRDEITDIDVLEAGRARALAAAWFVDIPIDHFEDMAARVVPSFAWEEPMAPLVNSYGVGQGVVKREPYGVASVITPYNAPFYLACFKIGPALAAGCTVVLKPSPLTPLSAFLVADIAEEAGLPPGVLNVVTGSPQASTLLTTDPRVDLVSFTGSDAVGRKIMEQASPTLKKVVLELGGKSANIICEDADLSKVIPDVVANFTINSGQGCSMLTRTLVHESLHDDLVNGLKVALEYIKVGDPSADPEVTMGPLISAAQREKVEALIRTGIEEGAQLAVGGGRPANLDKGFYVEPTVFTGVDNSMTIAQKEFFGPVTVVIPFKDDADAIRIANESDFGLGGGVWSGDTARAYAIANEIKTGMVTVNGGGPGMSPYSPFGGYKQSGLGREWGKWGLDEFLQTKSIVWSVAKG